MLKKVILGGALCSAALLVGCASTNIQVPASAWTTSGMNQYLHNAKTLKDVRALLGEETLARKDKATSQRVSIWELEESRPGFYKEGSPCDEQECKFRLIDKAMWLRNPCRECPTFALINLVSM